jgi:hypothetical protein
LFLWYRLRVFSARGVAGQELVSSVDGPQAGMKQRMNPPRFVNFLTRIALSANLVMEKSFQGTPQ